MKMLDNLPLKFKVKWILVWLKTTLFAIILITLSLGIGALFGAEISAAALMPYIFVPFLNLFVVLMGFLGGKHIFSVTEPALLASGFISGLIACLDYAGWEALAAAYIVFLMALPAFVVGIVIQVIAYMRREKTPLGAQTQKKLWQSYLIVLLVTMAITPFTLDFDQKPAYDDAVPEDYNAIPLDDTLKSAIYKTGTADYDFTVTVTVDEVTWTSSDYDENYEPINVTSQSRKMNDGELHDLEKFVFEKTDFLYEADDLSTESDIMDADGATITLEFENATISKGGYYPYDNLSFKKLSDYIRAMCTEPENRNPSYAEKIDALSHPDEKSILYILQGTVSGIKGIEKDALEIIPTYDEWSFDSDKQIYSTHVEFESSYENGAGFVDGTLTYDLKTHALKFKRSLKSMLPGQSQDREGFEDMTQNLVDALNAVEVLD